MICDNRWRMTLALVRYILRARLIETGDQRSSRTADKDEILDHSSHKDTA